MADWREKCSWLAGGSEAWWKERRRVCFILRFVQDIVVKEGSNRETEWCNMRKPAPICSQTSRAQLLMDPCDIWSQIVTFWLTSSNPGATMCSAASIMKQSHKYIVNYNTVTWSILHNSHFYFYHLTTRFFCYHIFPYSWWRLKPAAWIIISECCDSTCQTSQWVTVWTDVDPLCYCS